MNGTYFVVREIETGKPRGPSGVSKAPHLYRTKGIADGIRKQLWKPTLYEVVSVQLTVIEPTPQTI